MRLIVLHDHMNSTAEVEVDADSVTGVVPFGSGSAVYVGDAFTVAVHEKPEEVRSAINGLSS